MNCFKSAFGHIDSLSTTIRANGNNIPVRDGHIRFESSSEVFPKSPNNIEEVIRDLIYEYVNNNYINGFHINSLRLV